MLHTIATLLAEPILDPGTGTAPPGAPKLLLILQWTAYIALAAAVAGILKSGGQMALASHGRGNGESHVAGFAFSIAAAVLIGSAAAIITLVV